MALNWEKRASIGWDDVSRQTVSIIRGVSIMRDIFFAENKFTLPSQTVAMTKNGKHFYIGFRYENVL